MAEKYFPFNSVKGDRTYSAADFVAFFGDVISSGVSANGDNIPVTAAGGLSLAVGPGLAWIKGHLYENTATKALALSAGGSLPRIDRVVTRLDVAERKITTLLVQGAPASVPVAPALLRNTDYYEIGLATIYVAASAISITNANITDTRTDKAVCGVVRCLVDNLDVGAFMKNSQAAFEEWFANLEEQFSGDVAGNLQNEINTVKRDLSAAVTDLSGKITAVRTDLDKGVYSTTAVLNVYTIPGASVKIVQGSITLTATANAGGLAVLYPNKLGNWAYTVTASGSTYTGTIVVSMIGIIDVALLTFAQLPWATIGAIGKAGVASKLFSRGDKRNVVMNGETITIRLEDFNHDDLASGGGKAPYSFMMENLLATAQQMNTTDTNVGGWGSSAMRSRMATYLSQLPADLRAVIKPVIKKTMAGNNTSNIVTTTDSLWLPSHREVGLLTGDTGYSGEGDPYPLFVDNASRIKKMSNGAGSANYWWNRSPNLGNTTYFRGVNSDGSSNDNFASHSRGVCLGLCV